MDESLIYHGLHVLSRDGHIVGIVDGRIDDPETGQSFALVTEKRMGATKWLLPTEGAKFHPGAVQMPFLASHITAAPAFDTRGWRFEEIERARTFWGIASPRSNARLPLNRFAVEEP